MGLDKKLFWDRRARKLQRKKRRKKHKNNRNYDNSSIGSLKKNKSNNHQYRNVTNEEYDKVIVLPDVFSFTYNLNGTVEFYQKTIKVLNKSPHHSRFLMDARMVTLISIDAIMYLIAVMRNHKKSQIKQYVFMGNYPIDMEAREIFTESGFHKFVKSKLRRLPNNSEKKSIISGKRSDAASASEFCDFVCGKLNVSITYTSMLYEVIIEMMSNVLYHAYIDDEEMSPQWYMYAEYEGGQIKILFLDTGVGIPNTVKKHSLYEKVTSRIGLGSESRLIKSALDGDFRTQTEKDNHGKGMPYINEFAFDEKVRDFHIISGKGHCWMNTANHAMKYMDLSNHLNGTIYSFSIVK